MRFTTIVSALASAGSALNLRRTPEGLPEKEPLKYVAPGLKVPTGIEDSTKAVTCTGDVPAHVKIVFSTMMGCNRPKPEGKGQGFPMCDNYKDGGCDNEVCHDFCHLAYTSEESYKTCKCNDWSSDTFKEAVPGAPCPLKVQPRCFNNDMYRSECEALHANPGKSAADLTVVPVSEWPEGDKSAKIAGCPA